MRSLSVLVAAALVVAVVVWWWFADSAMPAAPTGASVAATAQVAPAAGGALATSAPAERLAVVGVVDATADAAQAAAAGDAQLTTVTVVDGATGQPVAGAEVLWMDTAAQHAMRQSLGGTLWWRDVELAAALEHADQEAARFGHRTSSDAQGQVHLALGEYATLTARLGECYGQLSVATGLAPPANGYQLVLEPDLCIVALVVDHAGAPVERAQVSVVVSDERDEIVQGPEALSDGAGLAQLPHLQLLRRDVGRSGQDGSAVHWRVRCSWSPNEDPGVEFAIDDLPSQPIRLQLPPTGRIRLTATLGGHPDAALAFVHLVEVQPDGEAVQRRGAPGRRDADGWVRWRHVPLGKRFRVGAWDDDLDRYAEFAGPTVPGEEIEVVLQPAEQAIVWCGRLLDRAHRPFADVRATLRWSGPVESVHRSFATDGDGRFVVHLMDPGNDPEELVVDFSQIHLGELERVRASVELGACKLESGVRDLGDLVLGPAPLIVAGRFVAAGQVVKVDVDIGIDNWRVADRANADEDDDDDDEPHWFVVQHLLTTFDEDGKFEVRGSCPPGPLQLRVTPRNVLPVAPVTFEPGAELTIEVQPAPAVDVTVLLPARDEAGLLGAKLEAATIDPVTGQPFSRQARAFWLSGEMHLYWPGVPAGTYSLLVNHELAAEPLLRLDGVGVPMSRDDAARWQELDLRDRLRTVRLRVVGADGESIASEDRVSLLAEPATPGATWRLAELRRPAVDLLLPKPCGGLLVACAGYRPARLSEDRDDVELRLEPWPTQVLTFPDLPAVPDGCRVTVRLRAADESGLGSCKTRWGLRPVGEHLRPSQYIAITNGRAEVPIGDGDHQVELVVEGPEAALAVPRLQPGTVRPGAAFVAVSVPLDAWQETCREVLEEGR